MEDSHSRHAREIPLELAVRVRSPDRRTRHGSRHRPGADGPVRGVPFARTPGISTGRSSGSRRPRRALGPAFPPAFAGSGFVGPRWAARARAAPASHGGASAVASAGPCPASPRFPFSPARGREHPLRTQQATRPLRPMQPRGGEGEKTACAPGQAAKCSFATGELESPVRPPAGTRAGARGRGGSPNAEGREPNPRADAGDPTPSCAHVMMLTAFRADAGYPTPSEARVMTFTACAPRRIHPRPCRGGSDEGLRPPDRVSGSRGERAPCCRDSPCPRSARAAARGRAP